VRERDSEGFEGEGMEDEEREGIEFEVMMRVEEASSDERDKGEAV